MFEPRSLILLLLAAIAVSAIFIGLGASNVLLLDVEHMESRVKSLEIITLDMEERVAKLERDDPYANMRF